MFKRIMHYGLKTTICLAVILIIAALITQIVLWTQIPGRWMLSSLSKKTGMEFKAQEFRMSLIGKTRLHNLSIRSPLEKDPWILSEDTLLEHNSPLTLLMGSRFRLESISIKKASFRIMQDSLHRWNIQSLLELRKSRKEDYLNLPEISAEDIDILIEDNQKKSIEFNSCRMSAISDDMLWQFEIFADPFLTVRGSIAQARPFGQQIEITLRNPGTISSTIMPQILNNLNIHAKWNGEADNGQITGTIILEHMQIQDIKIAGTASIKADTAYISLQAGQLTVEHMKFNKRQLQIVGGEFKYAIKEEAFAVNHMNVQTGNSQINVDASWNMQSGQAFSSGRWVEITPDVKTKADCRWSGHAQLGQNGIKSAEINLEGYWQSEDKKLQINAIANGNGPNWKQSLWSIEFGILSWKDRLRNLNFGPGVIAITVDWPAVRAGQVELANVSQIDSEIYYLADRQSWRLAVDAKSVQIQDKEKALADIIIDAVGDPKRIQMNSLLFKYGNFAANAECTINLPKGDFKTAKIKMSGTLPMCKEKIMAGFSGRKWAFNAAAEGFIKPLRIKVDGELIVDANQPAKLSDEKLSLPFRLHVDGPDIMLKTASYKNQFGSWLFSGYYHTLTEAGRLSIDFNHIQLSILAGLSGAGLCEGEASGRLAADFKHLDFNKVDLNGTWKVENFKSAAFSAETASGLIHMTGGLAHLTDIHLNKGPGRITGKGVIDLNEAKEARFEIQSDNWPYPDIDSPVTALWNSEVKLNIDIPSRRISASGQFTAKPYLLQRPVGTTQFTANYNNEMLLIDVIKGDLFNGNIKGNLKISPKKITDSRGNIVFEKLQLEQIVSSSLSGLKGLSGQLSGRMDVVDADDKNPLELTKISLGTKVEDGHVGGAEIGSMRLIAFAGTDRVLVTESLIEIFSGLIQAQARWTRHDKSLIHTRAKFDDINLNQVIQLINPNAKTIEGIVDGEATLLTTADLQSLSGKIILKLSGSDLINSNIISSIYQSLAPGRKPSTPQGYGTVEIYPQGSQIEISSFYYFNEGVEVRGSGRIDDIRKGADSTVSGLVFGTTSPLGAVKLPGIRELDDLMGVLQVGSAVVKVKGTLNDIQTEVVPFPQVSGAIRSLLWKQLHEEGQ